MIGQTISHYRILEKLGEGGMGVVYKAEDTKLHRPVALKVLPRQALITEEDKTRFAREAQAAASLSHPNVAMIFEFDEVDDPTTGGKLAFIAMEYIDGETVKEKIKERPLPIAEVVNIAIAVAEGLSKAHEKGIVHRDIKSDNVMISKDGVVKIMDFGLAEIAGRSRVTKEGMTVGTTAYMSPEQALGEKLDQRTDIWSLGVVMYEMVTGRLPFPGDYEQAILYRVLNEEPEPITSLRSNVPMELERIVKKAMQKNRDERYQRVEDTVVDVQSLKKESESRILETRPAKAPTRKKKLRYILSGIAAVVIIIVGLGVVLFSPKVSKQEVNSIAVLPFVNMSNDQNQEYFSDGLSEELLNLLSKVPELKVIGRTSSFAFKGKNEDLRVIGQELGVAHILEGSVRKEGNRIRVTAQLIKASDGSHLWSERYDRDLEGIFELQDQIAAAVVKQLKLKLLAASSSAASSKNIEVHNLILQGNYFFDKLDKDNIAKAIDFYNQALAIDSTDARVWGKLANAISRQAWQNYIDQNTGYEKARHAALKAISLDNTHATGYLELADIKLYHDFDWQGADEAYQMALSLEPGNAEILTGIGDVQSALGRWKEAEQSYRKSILLNPLKPITHMDLGNTLTSAGRLDEAILSFKKVLELNPQHQRAHLYQGRNYLLMGKPELALTEMQQENLEIFKTFGLALVYHALGRKKEADAMLKEFTDKYQNNWSYLLAQLHAFRGDKDAAFAWLETAYNKRDSWLFWLKGDPLLKNLESDPRYTFFLRKMGLEK